MSTQHVLNQIENDVSADGRRHGRILCTTTVRCSNGHILDLSASGARVQWLRSLNKKPGAVLKLTIEGLTGNVTVSARIVWSRRTGWRNHQVGLHFTEATEEQRRQLGLIVRSMMVRKDEPWQGPCEYMVR